MLVDALGFLGVKDQNEVRLPVVKFLASQRASSIQTLVTYLVGRISWLRRVRLENPLGHGNFLSGLKLSGERDGGLGLARFSAVCPLGGHMYANGL